MGGPFPCCAHCHAAPQYMGSHVNACNEQGCAGGTATPVTVRHLVGLLLALAAGLWVVGMVVARVGGVA